MKFKIGDRVKSVNPYFYSGGIGTITKLNYIDSCWYWVKIQEFDSKPYDNDSHFLFTENELELVYQVEGFEV